MAEQTVQLEITGMTCDGCAQSITRALKRSSGVQQVRVDWKMGRGDVVFDPAETSEQGILDNQVFEFGYEARVSG